jgi:5-methylcytosine-specific restriction endonuclease McrA
MKEQYVTGKDGIRRGPYFYCRVELREQRRESYEAHPFVGELFPCEDCGKMIEQHRNGKRRWCPEHAAEHRRVRENARKAAARRARLRNDPEWAEKERARVVARGQARFARYRQAVRDKCSDGLCYLCLKPIDFDGEEWHVDHVHPRIKGGKDDLSNLKATHARCNLAKGDKVVAA